MPVAPIRIVLHDAVHPDRFNDGAIHVGLSDKWVARDGRVVRLERVGRTLLVLLCVNAGRNFTNEEMIEAAYGDNPNGGPERAEQMIGLAIEQIKVAAPMLGIVLTRGKRFTYVRPTSVTEAA